MTMKNRKYAKFEKGQISTPPADPPKPKEKRTMTHLEFLRRLTDEELGKIYAEARQSVAIEVWLDKFRMAREISLDDREIKQGIKALEQMGLLDKGRGGEILGERKEKDGVDEKPPEGGRKEGAK